MKALGMLKTVVELTTRVREERKGGEKWRGGSETEMAQGQYEAGAENGTGCPSSDLPKG